MLARKLHMLSILIVLIGALNWGAIGLFRFNVVEAILGRGILAYGVYAIVGLAALYLAISRDTYLPFLGETVMPCAAIEEKTPEHADTEVTIHSVKPGSKILYWAAEPETAGLDKINDWRRAYLEYSNAGVATADAAGNAILRIRKPQPYTVPMKGRLEAHVHWRVCGADGFIEPVQTTMLPL
jgi:uncharacterized membrane protein YuzA (DUF378 family)